MWDLKGDNYGSSIGKGDYDERNHEEEHHEGEEGRHGKGGGEGPTLEEGLGKGTAMVTPLAKVIMVRAATKSRATKE